MYQLASNIRLFCSLQFHANIGAAVGPVANLYNFQTRLKPRVELLCFIDLVVQPFSDALGNGCAIDLLPYHPDRPGRKCSPVTSGALKMS